MIWAIKNNFSENEQYFILTEKDKLLFFYFSDKGWAPKSEERACEISQVT